MCVLDLNVWPCHPHGTWQRALAHYAAGLPLDAADAKALDEWDRHPLRVIGPHRHNRLPFKADVIRRDNRINHAVLTTAFSVIEPGEVLGRQELTRRVAARPDMPGYARTRRILYAVPPNAGGPLYKKYVDAPGGPQHLFARRPTDIDRAAGHATARRTQHEKETQQ